MPLDDRDLGVLMAITVPLSVVLFGTSITSAYLSGGTMLFRGIAHAFRQLGAEVVFIEEDHPWLVSRSDYIPDQHGVRVLRYRHRNELDSMLRDPSVIATADLVLKFSGSSIAQDRFLDEALADMDRAFTLIYIDADAPTRLPYIIGHANFYLRRILPHFDGVWVMLGGNRAVAEYVSLGARRAWYLPVAIDPEQFTAPCDAPRSAVTIDLLFIGNPVFSRENRIKEYLIAPAHELREFRFAVAGADWGSVEMPENVQRLGYIHSDCLGRLYRSSRLVLNLTRE
jgi:spore maturation protein CgeB